MKCDNIKETINSYFCEGDINDLKNVYINKSKVYPVVIILIFSMLMGLVFGVLYISFMASSLYMSKNNDFDDSAQVCAKMIGSQISQTSADLGLYAMDSIERYKTGDYVGLTNELRALVSYNNYAKMCIVGADGKGVDHLNNPVDLSGTSYFSEANKYTVIRSYLESGNLFMVYVVPMTQNGILYGYLTATKKAVIDTNDLGLGDSADGSYIYLLDKSNNVIARSKESPDDFSYSSMTEKDVMYKKTTFPNLMDKDEKSFFEYAQMRVSGLSDAEAANIMNENGRIWFEKEVGINDWKLLVAKEKSLDSETILIMSTAVAEVLFVLLFQLIVFVLILVNQSMNNKKLKKMLYLDPVTQGDNWYKFQVDAKRLFRRHRNTKYAMVVVTPKKFRLYEDMHGHQQALVLLKRINEVFQNNKNKNELAVRRANDEFVALFAYESYELLMNRIKAIITQMCKRDVCGDIHFSVGIYNVCDTRLSPDRMNIFANIAKDTVEGTLSSTMAFFDDEMRTELIREKEIENTMDAALENNEFAVYLQPKYSTKDEVCCGAEALVRWISPDKGFISPGAFIPIFEKNGFITKLDDYMLSAVCKKQREWLDKGYRVVPVSVNVSRAHFTNPRLAQHISEIVDGYGVPHNVIELELTESAFFDNKDMILNIVKELRKKGFIVSMDDFGAGYSSLNSLKDLPLDVVKLDGEFFKDIEDVERGKTVIKDTISLAKDLNMKIVAEGIETREQVDFLSNLGCDLIQGFYFARPMPLDEFEDKHCNATETITAE